MAQPPHSPMKLRALQAGAAHYWSWSEPDERMIDAVGGVQLHRGGILTGPGTADGSGIGDWVGPEVRLPPGAYLALAQAMPLGTEFCLFGRFRVSPMVQGAGSKDRTLVALTFPGVDTAAGQAAAVEVGVWLDPSLDYAPVLRIRTAQELWEGHIADRVVYTQVAGALGPLNIYVAVFTGPRGGHVVAMVPGQPFQTVDFPVFGGAVLAGFCGAEHPDTRLTYRNLQTDASHLTVLPRGASVDEVSAWARLLETGRSSTGLLLPTNNSDGKLVGGIASGDTVLSVEGGSIGFAAPGPWEEGRVTLVSASDPRVFEVCALTVNDGAQLTVRRGVEGTEAQAWPDGTLIKGLLTADLLRDQRMWLTPYAGGRPPQAAVDWNELANRPVIPKTPADIGAVRPEQLVAVRDRVADLERRAEELEKGPAWDLVQDKPNLASAAGLSELRQIMSRMMERIIALENGSGGGGDTSSQLTDASGNALTDALGNMLTGVPEAANLVDQYQAQLTDASGGILTGQALILPA